MSFHLPVIFECWGKNSLFSPQLLSPPASHQMDLWGQESVGQNPPIHRPHFSSRGVSTSTETEIFHEPVLNLFDLPGWYYYASFTMVCKNLVMFSSLSEGLQHMSGGEGSEPWAYIWPLRGQMRCLQNAQLNAGTDDLSNLIFSLLLSPLRENHHMEAVLPKIVRLGLPHLCPRPHAAALWDSLQCPHIVLYICSGFVRAILSPFWQPCPPAISKIFFWKNLAQFPQEELAIIFLCSNSYPLLPISDYKFSLYLTLAPTRFRTLSPRIHGLFMFVFPASSRRTTHSRHLINI